MNSIEDNDGFDFEKLDIIKNYFSKIFSVLSEDIRDKLLKLKVSKEDLKSILKRIAFLPEEKQRLFIGELLKDIDEEKEK